MPWQTPEIEDEWAGMRPITADGLPILDRAGPFENAYIATGYAMQGVTLAPTAGQALAEMIATGRRPPILEPFRLDRFGRLRLPIAARRNREAIVLSRERRCAWRSSAPATSAPT